MIPLSSREFVETVDDDGITWKFRAKTGENELESFALYETISQGTDQKESEKQAQYKLFNDFLSKILIGWRCAGQQTESTQPAERYTLEEKYEIIKLWHKANSLKTTEKKT